MRITQVSKSNVDDDSTPGVSSVDHPLLQLTSDDGQSLPPDSGDRPGLTDIDENEADDAAQSTVTSIEPCLMRRASEGVVQTIPVGGVGGGGGHVGSTQQMASVAEMGRFMSVYEPKKTTNQRLVQKNGECNVTSHNVTKRKRKYLVDMFTTLVDMKWRYHLLMFAAAFMVTWFLFAIVWFTIAKVHGDDLHANNETWQACVDNVYDFKTALLFSIETQHTIGYGFRVIQGECHAAIFLMMVQSCLGLFIQSLITGIIFSKISRPKGRAQTIMFSHKAVICRRDGEYCLLFRVGDMRKSHIIGTSIRALLVKNRVTSEGESIPICQYPLNIETETSTTDSFVFLIWPVTIVHKITETSPLWDLSMMKLVSEHFEIIVILEGTIESTGMLTQVRTSYVPSEIIWGERLVPLMTYQQLNGHSEIDYSQFHNTTPMSMPEISAKEYAECVRLTTVKALDNDYPVSFTAPAVRPKQNRLSVYGLFPRKPATSSLRMKSAKKSKSEQKVNRSQNLVHFEDKTDGVEPKRRPTASSAGDLFELGNGTSHNNQNHHHLYKRNANLANLTNNSLHRI